MKKNLGLLSYRVVKLLSWRRVCGAALALFLLTAPATVSAETVVRTGDSVSIGVNQVVENNLYAAAGSISLSGEVRGDVYATGGSITINGPVAADLTVAGGTIQAHSSIGGDLRAVGGEIVIADEVGGDLFVFANHLKVLSSAKVAGNIYFYGAEAEIDGEVAGQVMGDADSFVISGSVAGTDISARQLTLEENANISGDVNYQSINDIERSANAVVEGNINKQEVASSVGKTSNTTWIFMLSWFFASLCALLLARSFLEKTIVGIKKNPARAGVVGVIALISLPVLAVVLISTMLGAWLGVITLLLFLSLLLIAFVLMPLLLGGYLLSFYRKKDKMDILAALTGMVAVVVLSMVPFVGGLVITATLLLTLGAITYTLYRLIRESVS